MKTRKNTGTMAARDAMSGRPGRVGATTDPTARLVAECVDTGAEDVIESLAETIADTAVLLSSALLCDVPGPPGEEIVQRTMLRIGYQADAIAKLRRAQTCTRGRGAAEEGKMLYLDADDRVR